MTRLLGAILAGGRSRRFGSDKADALFRGRTLIEWAVSAVEHRVDTVIVCGREGGIADRPGPDLGPLGGLAAALHFGRAHGFDAVLSVPCDTPSIPADALSHLLASGAPSYLATCPVIGLWPCALDGTLDAHLRGEDRSMRGWADRIGARPILPDYRIDNVNTLDDLHQLARHPDA